VQTPSGPKRRSIETGDSNDVFTIVQSGLKENDAVLLNPAAFETSTKSDSSTEESDDPAASDEPASSTDKDRTAGSPQQDTTAPKKQEAAS
jgi:hypothetical protein